MVIVTATLCAILVLADELPAQATLFADLCDRPFDSGEIELTVH